MAKSHGNAVTVDPSPAEDRGREVESAHLSNCREEPESWTQNWQYSDADPDGRAGRVIVGERARRAVLLCRLGRGYTIYCGVCILLTVVLLVNIAMTRGEDEGSPTDAATGLKRHPPWAEALEILLGLAVIVETAFSVHVVGFVEFFRHGWHILDFSVALLAAVSATYSLVRLFSDGYDDLSALDDFEIPLLFLRFILQPLRVLSVARGACAARQMQRDARELQVDFGAVTGVGPV
eukprot:TRINITY_DN5433_c0_g2_i2.p1 TRINITY_DN5433_c0_g2~~TRINITY_DN5433_c0_g2_i2.p1  ORF type:complete len:256 (-),score=42.49 TRINITY_DN5433_c0_g2_i2:58-765(-)